VREEREERKRRGSQAVQRGEALRREEAADLGAQRELGI